MGKIAAEHRQWYWLSRFLDTLPDPPDKSIDARDLTREQLIARYAHRAYYLLCNEKFDKKAWKDMMNPDLGKKKGGPQP